MKRFVSLSTALVLGTVLSREHNTHSEKMIVTKTDKPKKREEAIAHKQVDSIEEYDVEVKFREEYELSHA